MDEARTVGSQMPWVAMTFDHTEDVVRCMPEELWHWRPVDPIGRFFFSVGEITAHIADDRYDFAGLLDGNDYTERWFELPREGEVRRFKDGFSKAEVQEALRASRTLIERYTALPVSELNMPTDGTRKGLDRQIAYAMENGDEDIAAKLRLIGPASIHRVLMSAAVHEEGHRGALQTLLRTKGVIISRS